MTRPLIGVSGSHMVDDHGVFAGYHRSYVNDDYIRSVNEAGGVAILVPFTEDEEAAREIMSRVDGLVLSGGHDVYPLLYGEEPCRQIGPVWPARDKFDLLLLREAEKRGIPVIGICRGCQIINVSHGGTLYQDLSLDKNSFVKHSQNQDPATPTHTVEIQAGSRLPKSWAGRNGSPIPTITRQCTRWDGAWPLPDGPRTAPWRSWKGPVRAILWLISSIRK